MANPLRPIWSRWDVDPPAIHAREARSELRDIFGTLRDRSLVRAMTPAGAADCTDCGRRCRVGFVTDTGATVRGYIHCADCGLAEIPASLLERWELDTSAVLTAVFREASLAIEPRVPGRLWRVGHAQWAGRSREVWFVRGRGRDREPEIATVLRSRSKAVVFAPTEANAQRWRETTGNLVIPIEAATAPGDGFVRLDIAFVEGRIHDAGLGEDVSKPRRVKKRACRAANIEALRQAIVEHLRAARDHAFDAEERFGQARLLPRPTQKALGMETGLTESDVSRCLNDPEARELRLYWDVAGDLGRIMAWKGPVSMGRKK